MRNLNAHRLGELPIQGTEKGRLYAAWREEVAYLRNSRDPKERAAYETTRNQLCKDLGLVVDRSGQIVKGAVMPSSVHVNRFMSDLSVKYKNDEYIGDRLVPVVSVNKRSDVFAVYDERSLLNTPDPETGPDGDVAEVDRARSSDNYSVKDYALKDKVAVETLDNQDEVFDEMFDMFEDLNDSVSLRQEMRIASVVFTNTNYPTGQKHTAATKWDVAAGGTIISDILTAVSGLRAGGGRTKIRAACGIATWNVIANNAAIKGLFSNVREGLATTDAVARYFGIDELLVGRALQETANVGQTASKSRIWSTDNFAVLRVAERPTRRSAHFASTFQHGDRSVTQWLDPSKGPGGGVVWGKVGHSQDHKIVANLAGYLIEDVLT